MGNNQMLAADPRTGEIRGPIGQEITGVVTTPDQRTMFVNVQHPGEITSPDDFAAGSYASNFPDGNGAVPRSCTLVITREDGGVIGAWRLRQHRKAMANHARVRSWLYQDAVFRGLILPARL